MPADGNSDIRRRRALFITPSAPCLTGKGGPMRAGMHVLALARLYEVHVLVLTRFDAEAGVEPEPDLARRIASLTRVPVLIHLGDRVRKRPTNTEVLRRLIARPPAIARLSGADIKAVMAGLAGRRFDVILFGRLTSGVLMESPAFRDWAADMPRVLDIDDIESEMALREARVIGSVKGRIGHVNDLLDAVKLRLYEQRHFRWFDRVLVCSGGDRDKMARRHPGTDFAVLPNGVQVPARPPAAPAAGPPVLLFVGSMDHPPNADGILFFCREVLPLIRARGVVRLLIVGRNPPPTVQALGELPGVEVTGAVPDVLPYYRQAAVAIAPIRFGGGTRIKIIEALAHGCPVVSTTVGAEGLGLADGQDIVIADDAARFAAACAGLTGNRRMRERLALAGWATASSRFSIEAIAGHMARCLAPLAVPPLAVMAEALDTGPMAPAGPEIAG